VSCIEQVRKDIIKRRLQTEVQARKRPTFKASTTLVSSSSQNDEFDETLTKLAELAKGRVRFDEFTKNDSVRLLDLFVNNEQTLLKMYDYMFPNPTFKTR
jgi:hypothetical protein